MKKEIRKIRWVLILFMIATAVSGVTAVPVEWQLSTLLKMVPPDSAFAAWLQTVLNAYLTTSAHYPFLLYGYDWLAFAHIIIALAFIGPLKDPVRNIWVVEWAMLACILVWPLAAIAGHFRGIPRGWQLIDCSFGLLGLLPLIYVHRLIKQLGQNESSIKNKQNGNSRQYILVQN